MRPPIVRLAMESSGRAFAHICDRRARRADRRARARALRPGRHRRRHHRRGLAREAALRGLSVALFEAEDFASGTSSRSSKLIHGGLRYLAHGRRGAGARDARSSASAIFRARAAPGRAALDGGARALARGAAEVPRRAHHLREARRGRARRRAPATGAPAELEREEPLLRPRPIGASPASIAST